MTTVQPIDVRDMAIVHSTFRSAYDESARLVRANPTPSAERVTFLADHIDFGVGMLHHHHESEDALLYPLLVARVPEQAANTERVEHEHQLVAGAIDAVSTACATWRRQPSAETGEALAVALIALNDTLQGHLDDEEREIVPLAAVTLTQEEWDALGAHSRAQIPRNKMPIAFGMLLEPLGEADRAHMKSQLPAPVRLLYGVLIQRPWTKYATTLRTGT
ncbi:MAG: hemerythrin domain-containing protein [Actinomycetales bacterium]|nr:hemerythrin domain-containing protein [Actinomycetales bacterium]